MALADLPLSYCANVHPGETLDAVLEGLERYARPLCRRLGETLGVGLWMTRRAIGELAADRRRLARIADALDAAGLFTYTMNAFPVGDFHARRVKEHVYLPDWTQQGRLEYTCRVGDLLANLLPPGLDGSISTAPCSFKPIAGPGRYERFYPKLIDAARYLEELHERTGRHIRLAIEPEPCCVLETTSETIDFFAKLRDRVAETRDEQAVREHLGVCFDICHAAVEFEDPADAIARLAAADIRINKIHITCALETRSPGSIEERTRLADFVEERYLHQTFARRPRGELLSVADLTREHALAPPAEWLEAPSWRVHFHVPIHQERFGPLFTTRRDLAPALAAARLLPYAPHLEVETYTWDVLPSNARAESGFDLVDGLERELRSAKELLERLRREPAAAPESAS